VNDKQQGRGSNDIGGIPIRAIDAILIVLAVLLSLLLFQTTRRIPEVYRELQSNTEQYLACEHAANAMSDGSDYLTNQAQRFAFTQDTTYLENYFEEVSVTQRREKAVETLQQFLQDNDSSRYLEQALECSNELMTREYLSMRLVIEATGRSVPASASVLERMTLSSEDKALSAGEKLELAQSIVTDGIYQDYKDRIEENVELCLSGLTRSTLLYQQDNTSLLDSLLLQQQIYTGLLLAVIVLAILATSFLIVLPLNRYVAKIRAFQRLPMSGAYELQYLSHAYNIMYEENQRNNALLRHEAEHDPLTGLLNRGAYDKLMNIWNGQKCALLVFDVDGFKEFNDTYGHDMGDKVLQKVSRLLAHIFRSTDYPCRIGGDEFAVIMTDMTYNLRHVVKIKVQLLRSGLRDTTDGLPEITLSVGVAFSDRGSGRGLFKDADTALYRVKDQGRDGYAIYEGAREDVYEDA